MYEHQFNALNSEEELKYWLCLWRISGIGPKKFMALLKFYPQLSELFKESRTRLVQYGIHEQIVNAIKNPDWHAVDHDLKWAKTQARYIVTYNSPDYPQLLKEISDAPPILFVAGELGCLNQPQIAIVGSRNPTPQAMETAARFASELSVSGLVITSGLALGIDAAAHQGALKNPCKTIAVLGTGLDTIYPARHRQLAEQVRANGAIICEFPIGTPAKAENFPRRNRIISGMSLGVLVVEATLRSGSLITARLAGEQGRDVFAIPGSIYNPLARGCHALIRQGAKLVETVDDILEELAPFTSMAKNKDVGTDSIKMKNKPAVDDKKILNCVGFETTSMDQISERSGKETQELASILLALELSGHICKVPGGYIQSS